MIPRGLQALVIDDVPEVVLLCAEILKAEGFQVHGVYRALDALDWAIEHPVDLVLTDIRLPDMNGLDLVQRLREQKPDVTVIVMTGFGTMENAVRALRLGTQGFVLKPFTPDELVTVVRDVLEKQQAQRETLRLRAWLPLLSMNQILVTETDLSRLGELTVDLVAREGQADLTLLLLIDPDAQELRVQAARGLDPEAAVRLRIPVGQGLLGQMVAPDARTSALVDGSVAALPGVDELESVLLLPLRVTGMPIGVLVIGKGATRQPFQANDVEFFTLLGGQVASAVENVRLYEAARKRAQELATLNDISQMLSSVLGLEAVLRRITEAIESTLQVDHVSLFLLDELAPEPAVSITVRKPSRPPHMPGERAIARWVAQHQQATLINDVRQDARFSAELDETTGGAIRSILVVPLRGRERLVGVLAAVNKQLDDFTDKDRALLESVATPVAIAIENARLFEKLQIANQELVSAKEFSERILESIPNGLLVVDAQGLILSFNQAAAMLTGYSEVEVVGMQVSDLLDAPPDQPATFELALQAESSITRTSAMLCHRDGTRIPVQIRASALRDDSGQVSGAVGILTDQRAVKALEEERRRLDRLALLGEISAVVAHEIRNPIATISTGISLLASQPPGPEKQQFASMMLTEIRRVNRIIEDILLVARRPQLKLHPCDPVEIVEESLARHQDAIRKQEVSIRWLVPPQVPSIMVDSMRVGQVIDNLIANALDAMSKVDGHYITVGCSVHDLPDSECDSRFVQIAISDTGGGIPLESLAQIFEPFFTTKTRGTGLGLAIARRVVEEHGGVIQAYTQPGVASTFVIRLWEHGPQPCWQIRDCPVAKRDICPAYPGSMGFSCWTLTESTRCQDCEVYRRQQFLTERLSGVGETLPSRDASGRVM